MSFPSENLQPSLLNLSDNSKRNITSWARSNQIEWWPEPYVLLPHLTTELKSIMFPRDGVVQDFGGKRFYLLGEYSSGPLVGENQDIIVLQLEVNRLVYLGDERNPEATKMLPSSIKIQYDFNTNMWVSDITPKITNPLTGEIVNQLVPYLLFEPSVNTYMYYPSSSIGWDQTRLPDEPEPEPNTGAKPESMAEALKKVVTKGPAVIARTYSKAFGSAKPTSKTRSPELPRKNFPLKEGGKRKTKRRNNKPKKNNRKSKKAKAIHKNMKRSRSITRKMKKTSSRK
jgi:hypothetical protein